MDVRCHTGNRKLAEFEDGVLELRCKSEKCGARPGVIVLHQFKVSSGNVNEIGTSRFKEPKEH